MKLVLFDIDGTLLDSGGAGRRAMESAFSDVLSVEKAASINGKVSMAGKTDPQILKEVLEMHGITYGEEMLSTLMHSYAQHLVPEMQTGAKSLKPHVIAVLNWLDTLASHHCSLGLLTGNIEDGARIKLSAFGIWERFCFGAYGSDHEDRNRLLPAALESYRKLTGQEKTFRDCVVIGDTPRDIECSKPFGAFALAVATGPYDAKALRDAGADAVINDLSEAKDVLAPLLSS